jgi:hypothetical protein
MKVKIRIQASSQAEAELVRKHLLKAHPGLCLNSPREGTNPKYAGRQKWAVYGDIQLVPPIAPKRTCTEIKRRRRKS